MYVTSVVLMYLWLSGAAPAVVSAAVTSWRKMNPEIPAMSSVIKTRHRKTAYCR